MKLNEFNRLVDREYTRSLEFNLSGVQKNVLGFSFGGFPKANNISSNKLSSEIERYSGIKFNCVKVAYVFLHPNHRRIVDSQPDLTDSSNYQEVSRFNEVSEDFWGLFPTEYTSQDRIKLSRIPLVYHSRVVPVARIFQDEKLSRVIVVSDYFSPLETKNVLSTPLEMKQCERGVNIKICSREEVYSSWEHQILENILSNSYNPDKHFSVKIHSKK